MITAKELAVIVRGEIEGDPSVSINSIRPPEDAGEGCVVFIDRTRDAKQVLNRRPAAIICSKAADIDSGSTTLIRCKDPRFAFGLAMRHFFPPEEFEGFVHPSAIIEEGAVVYPSAHVGASCTVLAGSMVGDGTVIWPGCFIGRNVTIGEKSVLHPSVTVLDRCRIGKRVILHSGVVIGGDGFGYLQDEGVHVKIPQVGNVEIGDNVEIGANSAVDRATLGSTVIGRVTKIDNLVQVGHNCKIGENCIICGAVGISGSVEIGDGAVLAGQVGISDHVKIGKGAILGGRSGVYEEIPPGVFYSGFPARPHRQTMKLFSLLDRLPELAAKIDKLPDPDTDEKD